MLPLIDLYVLGNDQYVRNSIKRHSRLHFRLIVVPTEVKGPKL